ncbi:hypothetical protein P5G65_24220 [Paenibacillus chondroitinus]|uniref:Uncharacterized protein n=1 Tax=Paenibacillus chondroitinus TaxID=59842 RepID=A0ABU6DHJ8_9BACL|nr:MULTISPECIES: hypothetical protein [Paenibacillus]MCY9659615.1 hypothetical protein [Paenibacillus anseongense]MEB4797011.1 hypothetical protein [Paenibacillus chondroitinus]
MLLHDVNPQLMYVSQLGNQIDQQELKEPQSNKKIIISIDKITNLFKTKQAQVACCAPVCC